MNSRNVWLQWVRHGKAYTITKSQRKAARRERLRIVALFWGYTILLIERKRTGISFYCNREKKCREETLRRSVKRINNPNPSMIARAIFREIETELIREAKKHE